MIDGIMMTHQKWDGKAMYDETWRENDLGPRMSGMRCAQISLTLIQTVTGVTMHPVQGGRGGTEVQGILKIWPLS